MKNDSQSFLTAQDHYALLVQKLDTKSAGVYINTRNSRQEVAYRNRTFIIYEITGRDEHEVLDTLTVMDFECDDVVGASTVIRSNNTKRKLNIGYSPVQLWEYPIFMHLPLHCKLRWSTSEDRMDSGSLAFPINVRTLSRLDPREKGVIHCETGVAYAQEFEGQIK